jgi:GT2 family glycosyltransferase
MAVNNASSRDDRQHTLNETIDAALPAGPELCPWERTKPEQISLEDRRRLNTAMLEEQHLTELAALEDRHRDDLLELRAQVEECRAEARNWRRQFQLNYSFLHSLFRSPLWRASRPARGLHRLLGARGFDESALLAWSELDKDDGGPGHWKATGTNAYFVAPYLVPVGWLRVELQMTSPTRCQAVLHADGGHGPDDLECLRRFDVSGELHWRGFVHVSRPALGIRFDPCNVGGRFQLDRLRIKVLPPPHALLHAICNKLTVLWKHGLLPHSQWRGLKLLLKGHVRDFMGVLYSELQLRQSDPGLADEMARNAQRFIAGHTWERVIDRREREFLRQAEPGTLIGQSAAVGEVSPLPDGEYPDLHLPTESEVDVSVVIPTIDTVDWVVRCIQSCRQHLPRGCSCEFLVVDDGTRDAGILKALTQAADDLEYRLLQNHQNLGFSATVNHGMRVARGRLIVLCNNDIVFYQPWLEPLETAFAAEPELGIVGAKLLYPDGTLQHAGMDKVPGHLHWIHPFAAWPGDHPKANLPRYVWSVTGALFAVKHEVLRKFGGFSTAYGAGYEDLDYCLYAWMHGVRVGYRPKVAAYHLEGATRGARSRERVGKPLWWAERERAGAAYFDKKWAALRHVESFERLRNRANQGLPKAARELAPM